MANIFDYLMWRGDVPFDADPFNEVDNLVLAELSYTFFEGLVPDDGTEVSLKEVCDGFFSTHSREDVSKESNPIHRTPLLMDGMLSGRRFSKTRLARYVNKVEADNDLQFSAITFRLSDGTDYVAFRGTDNTVVGWKEDFNMSYLSRTEGQKMAAEYLTQVGSSTRRPLRVGGHSKGGNFAVFASAFCGSKIQDRIITVYSNDGPGFRDEIMNTGEYKRILPKVISIVPDTSVIGMLLTSKVRHQVVKSSESGLSQHDGQTWQVERNRFVSAELTELAEYIRSTQKDWLSKIDDESRESFVNILFSIFEATGIGTFGAMKGDMLKSIESMMTFMGQLPKDKQRELMRVFGELIQSGGQVAFAALQDKIKDLSEQDDQKS